LYDDYGGYALYDDDDFGFESPFCKSCKGTGCEECDGSGEIENDGETLTFSECGGEGVVSCGECGGDGTDYEDKELDYLLDKKIGELKELFK
jgi:DnaJ-class molecular chaperone